MISLAVGTRTVGVILIGAVALSQLIRTRRISWVLCLAAGVPTAYWLAQSALLGGTGDYLSVFSIDAGVIWPNVTNYWAELYPPWANGVPGIAWSAALVLLGLIIVVGYAAAVARGVTAREAFVPLYAGVLLIWPHYQGLRMLIPLIPLAGLYGCLGARRVAELGVFRSRRWILPAAGVLLAVGYAEAYSRRIRDYSPTIGGGVAKAETRELFQAVGERTAPDAVCVFFKPRVLALYTGRRASACHEPRPGEDLTDYFREIGATHLILGPWRQQSPEDFVAARRERLPVVYSNADFIVFDLAAVVLRGASTSP